jgi:hypothetical protein
LYSAIYIVVVVVLEVDVLLEVLVVVPPDVLVVVPPDVEVVVSVVPPPPHPIKKAIETAAAIRKIRTK